MYVMSTLPPSQQSIAGGIFNTVNKLCSNLGLGIATSVQSSVALHMTPSTPAIRPYLSVYWFAAAASGVSLVLIPFLTIGKQGNDVPQKARLVSEAGEKTTVTANTDSMVSSAVDITEHEKR
jgi:hypothetical protein